MHPVWFWIVAGWFAGFHHWPWVMLLVFGVRCLVARDELRLRKWVVAAGVGAWIAGAWTGTNASLPAVGERAVVIGHRHIEDRLLHRVRTTTGRWRSLKLPALRAKGAVLWVPGTSRLPVIPLSGSRLERVPVERPPTLVGAVTLGDPAPPRLKTELRQAGLSHVLAISGLHLSLVTLAVLAGLGRLHRLLPLRWRIERRALEVVVCLAFVWWYRWITGASVSTTRAAIMMSSWLLFTRYLGAGGLGTSLFWSATCLWTWDPGCWRDPGFQLSFSAVAGIAAALRWAPGSGLAGSVAASVGASLATLPIVWFHFARVSPLFLINNLFLLPLFSIIIIPSSFFIIFITKIWPTGGGILQRSADGMWATLPGPLGTWNRLWPEWTPAGAAVWTVVLAASALWIVRRRGARRLALAAVVLGALWILPWGKVPAEDGLRLTFLAVRGESTLVRLPGGRTLLVDAGSAGLAGECARRGVTRIDRVVITHNHADHVQELIRLAGELEVGLVWVGPRFPEPWRRRLRGLGVAVALMPPCARLGPGKLWLRSRNDVRGPDPPAYWSDNDASLVLELAWGGRHIWFLGDIEAAAERDLIRRGPSPGRVDLVKVAHHGRITSSTAALWMWIQPDQAVICGREASSIVLDRLGRAGAVVRVLEGGTLDLRFGERPEEGDETTCGD
ncbi:ComEC/Rec2 family competence protein [Myxococcota bacterium]|nr:ComEC/Rec2 family competence protein [Myxococcota bacterium]